MPQVRSVYVVVGEFLVGQPYVDLVDILFWSYVSCMRVIFKQEKKKKKKELHVRTMSMISH